MKWWQSKLIISLGANEQRMKKGNETIEKLVNYKISGGNGGGGGGDKHLCWTTLLSYYCIKPIIL